MINIIHTQEQKRLPQRLQYDPDPEEQLYKAVHRYIDQNGGTLVCIDGIEANRQSDGKFNISIKCMGSKPR